MNKSKLFILGLAAICLVSCGTSGSCKVQSSESIINSSVDSSINSQLYSSSSSISSSESITSFSSTSSSSEFSSVVSSSVSKSSSVVSSSSQKPLTETRVTFYGMNWTGDFSTDSLRKSFVTTFNTLAGVEILKEVYIASKVQGANVSMADGSYFHTLQLGSSKDLGEITFNFGTLKIQKITVNACLYYKSYMSQGTLNWSYDKGSQLFVEDDKNVLDLSTTEAVTAVPQDASATFDLGGITKVTLYNSLTGRVFVNSIVLYY